MASPGEIHCLVGDHLISPQRPDQIQVFGIGYGHHGCPKMFEQLHCCRANCTAGSIYQHLVAGFHLCGPDIVECVMTALGEGGCPMVIQTLRNWAERAVFFHDLIGGMATKMMVIITKNPIAYAVGSDTPSQRYNFTRKFATQNWVFWSPKATEKSGNEIFRTAETAIGTVHGAGFDPDQHFIFFGNGLGQCPYPYNFGGTILCVNSSFHKCFATLQQFIQDTAARIR